MSDIYKIPDNYTSEALVDKEEYNKMYNFTIAEAVDAYNVKEKAKIAYEELIGKDNGNNNIQ